MGWLLGLRVLSEPWWGMLGRRWTGARVRLTGKPDTASGGSQTAGVASDLEARSIFP